MRRVLSDTLTARACVRTLVRRRPDDLPACVSVLVDGFYKDILTLAKNEFSEEEMEVLRPTLAIFNDGFASLTRVLLGFEASRRLSGRMRDGGVQRVVASDALMLALQERSSGTIIGVAELSQQPCDGKVPGDLRLPELPWARRPPRVAYLCNLAVLRSWRGRGLGSVLIDTCERLVMDWGFEELYLHAATKQERLLQMYARRQYEALPAMDQPRWVLALSGREETRYHRKALT